MDAKERFKRATAAEAHGQLMATGWNQHFFDDFAKAQEASGATDNEARLVVTAMEDEYLIHRPSGSHYQATPHLALLHEAYVPEAAHKQNKVRRDLLGETSRMQADGARWVRFDASDAQSFGYPFERLRAAARILDAGGFLELASESSGMFDCQMRSRGNELMEDEASLRAALPVSVGEDDELLLAVTPDVLKQLIVSCEQLLESKQWTSALDELRRGDDQYAKGDWVNAVREYYSALESGFKYALHVEGKSKETNALRSLARIAAERSLIPLNYQALFGFADSIRSPRSHGAGPTPEPVEVNQPEALLMGNLTRSLLVYLGSRAVGST